MWVVSIFVKPDHVVPWCYHTLKQSHGPQSPWLLSFRAFADQLQVRYFFNLLVKSIKCSTILSFSTHSQTSRLGLTTARAEALPCSMRPWEMPSLLGLGLLALSPWPTPQRLLALSRYSPHTPAQGCSIAALPGNHRLCSSVSFADWPRLSCINSTPGHPP